MAFDDLDREAGKHVGGAVAEKDIVGYTVAYDQDEIQFPVYVIAAVAAALIAAAVYNESLILLLLGFMAACGALYNFPLIETGRPRLGAGQYGLFVEGLGLVDWRAVDHIEILPDLIRGLELEVLEIGLKTDVENALIIDWRKRPIWRVAMRLPWKMPKPRTIRITLGVLDRPSEEIHATFLRMWRYYRGADLPPLSHDDDDDKTSTNGDDEAAA